MVYISTIWKCTAPVTTFVPFFLSVKTLSTGSEKSAGEHECNRLYVFCSSSWFTPAKPSWNAVIYFGPRFIIMDHCVLTICFKGDRLVFLMRNDGTRLQEELFEHMMRRRLTFRSKLKMMCTYSTTIKDYVLCHLWQQKPAFDSRTVVQPVHV